MKHCGILWLSLNLIAPYHIERQRKKHLTIFLNAAMKLIFFLEHQGTQSTKKKSRVKKIQSQVNKKTRIT